MPNCRAGQSCFSLDFRRFRIAIYNTTPTTITAGRNAGIASQIPWSARYSTCRWLIVVSYPAARRPTPANGTGSKDAHEGSVDVGTVTLA